MELTREDFEERTRHLIEKLQNDLRDGDAGGETRVVGLTKVLLVGGMSRMPMVREMISELSPVPLVDDVNPDEAVAIGAAIQAILVMLDEEQASGEKVLPEDTRQQFSSREGALIQVTNITSHTLGVVLWDEGQLEEYVYPMISKMSAIPASAKNFFGTASANMPKAVVRIVEGESTLPGGVHSARHLRRRVAALPSQGFSRRAGLRVQRESSARSRRARRRQPDQSLNRAKHRPRTRGHRCGGCRPGRAERVLRCWM